MNIQKNENLLTEKVDAYSLDIQGGVKYLLVDDQYYIENDKITKFAKSFEQVVNMQAVKDSSYSNHLEINI